MKVNIKKVKIWKSIFKWVDGSVYEGEFYNNNINGKGKYVWGDKRDYEGDWVNNKMEGKGIFYGLIKDNILRK